MLGAEQVHECVRIRVQSVGSMRLACRHRPFLRRYAREEGISFQAGLYVGDIHNVGFLQCLGVYLGTSSDKYFRLLTATSYVKSCVDVACYTDTVCSIICLTCHHNQRASCQDAREALIGLAPHNYVMTHCVLPKVFQVVGQMTQQPIVQADRSAASYRSNDGYAHALTIQVLE